MLRIDRLESRDTPAPLYASAGGELRELDPASGATLRTVRPFEQSAAAVPLFVATDGDAVYVGAGTGGGPRLDAIDARTLETRWSVFVGDPSTRTGVSVAAWARRASLDWHSGIPAVQVHVNRIPPLPGVDLSGITLRVLPRDQWDSHPDVSGYFRPVTATTGEITLRAGNEAAVVHELGHAIDWLDGGFGQRPAAELEAAAEAFVRWALHGESSPAFDSPARGA